MKLIPLSAALACLTLAACGNDAPGAPPAAPPATDTPPVESLLLPLPEETSTEIRAADLDIRVKTLADDIFEGRGPGTPAGEASADWIAAEMSRIGLKPGGPDGSWFQ
ncbi:MAG: peptidase M28, partial [Hyphomonas sp.]